MPKPKKTKNPLLDAVELFRNGQLDKADRKLRQIISANPTEVDAMHLRAMIAMNRSDTATAISVMQRALNIKPNDTALLCNLGNMLMVDNRPTEALPRFLAAIAADPDLVQAHAGAGTILLDQGQYLVAEPHFRAVLDKAPQDGETQIGLIRALTGQARASEAAELARLAIAKAPQDPVLHAQLAVALGQLNDFDGAAKAHRQAMVLTDNAPNYWLGLVAHLAAFGHVAEAETECRALIAAHPDFAPAHVRLSHLVRKSSPAEIAELERLLAQTPLDAYERIETEFALGSALEGNDAVDQAFAHYAEGNRQARALTPYSEQASTTRFGQIKAAFDSGIFVSHQGRGNADPTPVFVVGMPRSGTTLVEQILCSHPDVAGANELEAIPKLFAEFISATAAKTPHEALANATAEQLENLGATYLAELRSFSPDARFIVDKLPANFAYLGFIALILPNAKIVHCRRDALDTCLSIYKTRFVRGSVAYGYEMGELGHYYRLYEDMMRFWDGVLPHKPINISYEDLVADTRRHSERLLAAVGLDWAESCERFYETRRPVLTASMTQVRRPIYKSSVGSAARFGAALDPLRQALMGE